MGCGSCNTGACSTTGGCGRKGGCQTGGCNKLNTYDWFNGMKPPNQSEYEAIYEIRFKNTRKGFFRNVNGLSLITGDFVVVESDRGYDVGQVSLGGILAELQMKKKRSSRNNEKVRKIYRRASKEDLQKLQKARSREQETLVRTRAIIRSLNLEMKMSDVEYQGDNSKAIFYYIADQRVDFRELIKYLANEFRIRVEMKQIGLRHESGLVGGIGSCGRELCCSTWLTDFKSVSTSAARFQNLSLNPMKISGQCGRLKCCLNFELDTYINALEDIPKVDRIQTDIGQANHQKTDIFKRIMWFSYENETTWIPLSVEKVVEMAEMNKRGEKPASLRSLDKPEELELEESLDFVDVVGQATLREDPKRKKRKKKKKPLAKGGVSRNRRDAKGGGAERKEGGRGRRNERGKSGAEAKSGGERGGNRGNSRGGGNPRKKNQGGKNTRRNPNTSNSSRGPGKNTRRNEKGSSNKGAGNSSNPDNPSSS